MPASPAALSSPAARIAALDGVRGIAALIVLLHHASLLGRSALQAGDGTAWELLEGTPVKLLLLGTEAVLVFFVLSGLVVAIPAFRAGFHWPAYGVSRLLRLYLPVWGALALAAALVWLFPRDPSRVNESWLSERSALSFDWGELFAQATLTEARYPLSNPIWSLRWELLFSVLLPVFVGLALLLRRWAGAVIVLALLLSVAGRLSGISWLTYLPIFLAGTMLATRLDAVRAWGERAAARGWALPALAAASALLLIASWLYSAQWIGTVAPWTESPAGVLIGDLLFGLAAFGAVGVIVVVLAWPAAARRCEGPIAQWLGGISFSLYLIHVPILATLAYAFGADGWPWAVAVGVPLSIVAAWGFWFAVERPAHRLARQVGARLAKSAPQPAGPPA